MLYDADDKLLLCGDHVLMKITPNIGRWPDSDPDPLKHFLESLEALKQLDVRLALPGHRWLIRDWQGRLSELIEHHHERLEHTLDALEGGAETVYEVAIEVFKIERFTTHEWRFAAAETLAHLERLRAEDKVARTGDSLWRYRVC